MSAIALPFLSSKSLEFPPTDQALTEPNGLLAGGGDLSPERLLYAYRRGIFPWYEAGQPILWWSPDPRALLFPAGFHLSRSLRKLLRKCPFDVTADLAFEDVMTACAEPRAYAQGTWITPQMSAAYAELHRLGYAHSIEVWHQGDLVGGLYGLALGRVFFGESMFSREANSSKVAFAHLVAQLRAWRFQLIDCQVSNNHLFSLGAEEWPREDFEQMLLNWAHLPSIMGPWELQVPALDPVCPQGAANEARGHHD